MAYSTSNPPRLMVPSVGTAGGNIWQYVDADALSLVIAADYISNGYDLGLKENDIVFVTDTNLGNVELCVVSSVTADGAATLSNKETSGVTVLTEATTLSADQSGELLSLSAAGGFAVTLPAPEAGLEFEFVVGVAPTTAYTIVTGSSANIIHGQIASAEDAAGSVATVASADTVSFVANTAIIGDTVKLRSDGTSWFITGFCNVQDAITTTQAS